MDANSKLILSPGYNSFKEMLQKVKTARPDVATLALTMRPPQLVLGWLTLYEQMGGHAFIDLARKSCVFDDAIALRALETYRDIYVNFVPENLAPPADLEMFRTGKAAFYIDGAWNVTPAAESLGDKFAVTTFPQLGERNALVTTNHAFIIPKGDRPTDAKTKAILEFIKYWGENNWKWSEAGHLPAYTPSTKSAEFARMPWPGFYVSTMDVAVPIYTIPNANLHQIPATTDPIQKGMRGTVTPAEAIREVKSNLNTLIPQL
jgi:multiple sugar transport system substrate-binding protein